MNTITHHNTPHDHQIKPPKKAKEGPEKNEGPSRLSVDVGFELVAKITGLMAEAGSISQSDLLKDALGALDFEVRFALNGFVWQGIKQDGDETKIRLAGGAVEKMYRRYLRENNIRMQIPQAVTNLGRPETPCGLGALRELSSLKDVVNKRVTLDLNSDDTAMVSDLMFWTGYSAKSDLLKEAIRFLYERVSYSLIGFEWQGVDRAGNTIKHSGIIADMYQKYLVNRWKHNNGASEEVEERERGNKAVPMVTGDIERLKLGV